MKLHLHSTTDRVGEIAVTRRGFTYESSAAARGPRLPVFLGLGFLAVSLATLIYCGV